MKDNPLEFERCFVGVVSVSVSGVVVVVVVVVAGAAVVVMMAVGVFNSMFETFVGSYLKEEGLDKEFIPLKVKVKKTLRGLR